MRKRIWLGLALVGGVWLLVDHTRSRAEPEPAAAAPLHRDAHELAKLVEHLPITRPAAIELPAVEAPAPDDENDAATDDHERDQLDAIIGQIPEGQGAAYGEIRDVRTGEPAPGATILALSIDDPHAPELVMITDELGRYSLIGLAPGRYKVTVYYENKQFDRDGLVVLADGATALSLDVDPSRGQPLEPPPVIEHVATGRTFAGVVGVTTGSQDDTEGVSISSHCGVENQYIVEEPENEFLEETDVILGGTNAEYRGARVAR